MQGFPFTVPFFALMLMNGIANLVTTIPTATGYVGTFEAAGVSILTANSMNGAVSTAYTVVLHAALWLPITLLGAWLMGREGLSRTRVREESINALGLFLLIITALGLFMLIALSPHATLDDRRPIRHKLNEKPV